MCSVHHTVSRGLCPTGPSCEKKKAPESHRRRPPSVAAGPCCGQSHYLIAFSLRLFSSFLSFFSAGQRTISFCSFSSLFRNALDNRNEPSFIAKAPQITQPHTRDVSAKNTRWACVQSKMLKNSMGELEQNHANMLRAQTTLRLLREA